MADGSIRIETKLDNSSLKQQIKELERELKNIQKEQAQTEAQLSQTRSKYDAEREFDSQFPEEFSHREEIDKKAAAELDPLIAKQEELNQKKRQYLAMLDAAKAKLAEQANIASASKQVDDSVKADTAMGKVQSQADYNSLLDATLAKMAAYEAAAGRVAAQTGLTKEQILATNPQYQKLSDTVGMLETKAAQFGNEAENAGKKTTRAMDKAEKSTRRLGNATKFGIGRMIKMNLIMMGVMSVIRGITTATQEYMAVNTELEGQMNTLNALWGQVLGPAIEWIIGLLLKAVSVVNAFVYALTGINFVARANEAALKKQAKAAGASGASFDEQNKVGTSANEKNPVTLLDDAIDNIPQKLRELIESGDWYGAGKFVGEALMEGIESVDWQGVGNKIGEIIGGAIAFILGFALALDPATIIGAINDLAAGLFNALASEIQNMDWIDIGKRLVDLIIWGLLMADPATAILSVILSPNGDEMVAGASRLIGSIVAALFQAVIGMALRIGEIGSELWNTLKTYFDDYVDWEGTPGEIIEGLFNGIVAALVGVGKWIDENVWHPLVEGFTDCIDWDGPAGDVIDGLKDGLTNGISKIKQAGKDIWSAIKETFSSVGTWFKTTFSNAWQAVKDVFSKGGKIFDGIKDGIASTFKTIVNGLIDGINKVIKVPFNAINGMLNTIRGINILGVTPFKSLWSYNPLSVPQIPKLALGGIVNRPGRGVPAIIGEAGAEAVLPLENNTEWMDILADKIGGNVTIPIYLDGKKMYTYMVDIGKRRAFAANGG